MVQCLPIQIDVGTNNEHLINDPAYLGLKQPRDRSVAYDELIQEFLFSAKSVFGETVLLQFEDFGNLNAFRLIQRHQMNACTFNDDIQGTASVAVAGIISSLPLTGKQKVMSFTALCAYYL